MEVIYGIIIFCWAVTVFRLSVSSVSSDILIYKQNAKAKSKRYHLPTISILIPAYNEELTITRTLESVIVCDYPASKVEVIVVNDGSTDSTEEVVKQFRRHNKGTFKIRLINRPNKGKARALNYVIRNCARNSLVLCLDADTTLNAQALRNAGQYFKNRQTLALACYADIIEDGSLIGLAQRIEYIVGYRVKSACTNLGVNYVIPGTGSVFRRSILKRVHYYESNTLTEDLDLTLKIMASKKRNERIDYARDVVAYTEAVHSVKELLTQRVRWTYGRAQVFVKRKELFFSRSSLHDKRLTWGMLPYTLIQDLSFLLSPLVTVYFVYYAVHAHRPGLLASGTIILSVYLIMCIWSVEHLSVKEKLRLSYYAPPMYFIIYLTAFAEYYALVRAIAKAPEIKSSLKHRQVTWSSPERVAAS